MSDPDLDVRLVAAIDHKRGCPEVRIECYDVPAPWGHARTARCGDCAQQSYDRTRPDPVPPDDPDYARLWVEEPDRIRAGLADHEVSDPTKNPQHALAEPFGPGHGPPKGWSMVDRS